MIGSQHLLTATAKTADEFRDRKLVDLDPGSVQRIEYQALGASVISFDKSEEGFQIVCAEKNGNREHPGHHYARNDRQCINCFVH